MADFDAAGQEFLAWLQRSGAEISPKIKLEDLRQAHAGRGISKWLAIGHLWPSFLHPPPSITNFEES
jgi:SET domain-containing protein 6